MKYSIKHRKINNWKTILKEEEIRKILTHNLFLLWKNKRISQIKYLNHYEILSDSVDGYS